MTHKTSIANNTLTRVPPALGRQPDGSEAVAIVWEVDGDGTPWPAGVVLVDGERVYLEAGGRRRQIARCDLEAWGLPAPSSN
ncbi:MAG: hypothetical protein GXX96_19970 [Planctomycetaceae bacterium]|nr:hypothetical protein [Planctomycetaceae bacterium]